MNDITHNLYNVKQMISQAEKIAQRPEHSVSLLAVSKTKSIELIQQAIDAGQREFGENYVQEGVDKIAHFSNNPELIWHFIGPLQSNKSRLVAENFDWCHTVDRQKIAQRLNDQRPEALAPLNVLIQINISDEESKSGIGLDQLALLAEQINQLPNLVLRGLMAIPAPEKNHDKQRQVADKMAQALALLSKKYPQCDTLSLGMSDDMQSAIAAGSTMVRIGSAIFGARHYD